MARRPLETALRELRSDPELGPHFAAWRLLPARPARTVPFPPTIDPRLRDALRRAGIEAPYTHQAQAAEAALSGRNVVVVTPTASGKTLCYNLPVLQTILDDPSARALYLFPTKALAQDQMDELHGLVRAMGVDIGTFTYDGDTPPDARRKVRMAGHIVVTNPDMLHTGILPHHTKWMKLFENLRFVVIDEMHQYRGVFGSHVANVIRRLRRICRFYGSDPVFICCSATIANPKELAERLVEAPFELVDESGAPAGPRVVAVYNPPVVNAELGIRRSALTAARDLAWRLLRDDIQTIVFAPSRMSVELLLTYLRETVRRRPGEAPVIEGYRGGYLPGERRAIEKGLREGRVRGVVATNALELGIDIGGLDASILVGYPGTLASAWQQMGRAGRRADLSFSCLVTNSTALNQFLASHPEYLFETAPEAGLVDPDNLYVRVSHLKCAAFELPFEEGEPFGQGAGELLDLLAEEDVLYRADGRYHWMAESYPAEQVSLRSAAVDNVVIIESSPDDAPGRRPRVIGEVDRPSAPTLVHEGAIYFHGGQQYHVDRLDWEEQKAYVRKVNVDYYTDANLAVELDVLESFESLPVKGGMKAHGEVAVTFLATLYKKVKLHTHENVGWGKIHLPQEDEHTTAYWLALDDSATEGLSRDALQQGLWGLAHVLGNLAPLFLMCDARDLHAVPQVRSPHTGRPTVFLWERCPGGVGYARRLFAVHDELARAALEHVQACACPSGCPSCCGPGPDDASGGKAETLILLRRLCPPLGRAAEPEPSRDVAAS
ncbi:MAG TPA: DEAD/DEAH box helicase [Dehalococcoidia bacterium]|nr:DEAD/DEAH box helicase [Dehalococcoidia bacterium]